MGLTWYDPPPQPRPHFLTPTCALIFSLIRALILSPYPAPLRPIVTRAWLFWPSVQLHKVQLTAFQSVPLAHARVGARDGAGDGGPDADVCAPARDSLRGGARDLREERGRRPGPGSVRARPRAFARTAAER